MSNIRIPKGSTQAAVMARLVCAGVAAAVASALLCTGCANSNPKPADGAATAGVAATTAPATPAPAAPTTAAPEAAAADTVIEIKSFKFQPDSLEVKAGTAVTWKNADSVEHTVWSGTPDQPKDAPFKATVKGDGGTYSYTFKEPGEYPYFCDFHHRMKGKVVVK